ncbi:MAG: DUF5668 domain-containing protein [Bryobacterales bacterium]|nr:DUF5668 domain-containing protein [Bryobacterales bacterium]
MSNGNGTLMCAIRGPILLIALGTLLAVDHFGSWGFWRTWPVLIILFGVLKLLERVALRPPSPPPDVQGGYQP